MPDNRKRIEPEFERWLDSVRNDLSKVLEKDITFADTQRIVARTSLKGFVIVNNGKRRKRVRIDDLL